ncbi:hypothetical protein BpHYR1_042371 [Brachionus plicatilis]|uniref:Uncharacterized protein n=1 Tax=Brachionus plicatilis TaxID=10195 RepID=A0A3M7Q5L8_BRAPC|nr:hypothetical protein BpHYR1_042371 [Brachionus plicatilis]
MICFAFYIEFCSFKATDFFLSRKFHFQKLSPHLDLTFTFDLLFKGFTVKKQQIKRAFFLFILYKCFKFKFEIKKNINQSIQFDFLSADQKFRGCQF